MKPLPLLLAVLLALPAVASDFTTQSPDAPRIPAREFSASALGVLPDATAPVTDALQKAIDQVGARGGGRLTLAPGTYLVGPLKLTSRLDLHLSAGVVLRLLPRESAYPVGESRFESLLVASGATDLRISGAGKIDGQGEAWWRAYRAKELLHRRPQLILFDNCERVELTGFTSINPPNTHIALRLCKEVTLRNLVLDAPDDSPNTDGINISGKNYLITGCRISTGDDNIVVLTHSAKGWELPVCENFVIRDCALGFGHGLSIGSYTGGGIRNLLAERITFDGTTAGIRMKADRDRGGLVESLTYRDITMRGVKNPVYLTSYYPKTPKSPESDQSQPVTATTPRWQKILIENLSVTDSVNSIILWGLPEMPLGEITLRNARFATEKGARFYHAPRVVLDRVSLKPASGESFNIYPLAAKSP